MRVTATREIAEVWEQQVRRQIQRTGQAVAEVRIREPLGAMLGTPTLAALATVLAKTPGWERQGDAYQHDLDGGYVRYDPGTRELEIVAVRTAEVTVTAEATATAVGRLTDELREEGEGMYYDDEWGGVTEQDARRSAQQHAAARLDATARIRLNEAHREIDEQRGAEVLAEAEGKADTELSAAVAARSGQLRDEAAERLTAVGIAGRNLFYQALGTAYRDAITAYARSRGADHLHCTEDGGVIDIEFELDVN
ncbi:molecular chaperone DnaJ [Catenulispora sp. GP43]|uniref:molecular chaperone DnaJ n=1 Tax=Catenulispora sp. GP43 TaxID=3156263 RepID=UPI003510ED6B